MMLKRAKVTLWESCNSVLLANGLTLHMRRDSDKRSQLDANISDMLRAFEVLDACDSMPTICCEASMLHKIPPLSLDPVAEQVQSNTQTLTALSSVIENLEKRINSLLSSDIVGSQHVLVQVMVTLVLAILLAVRLNPSTQSIPNGFTLSIHH